MRHRVRAELHFVAALLIALSGCAEWMFEHMNDPSRDAWQQPKAVIQALNIAPGARVADLGADGGYFTFPLAEAVGPEGGVYAVDVDEASLKYIDRQAKQRSVSNIQLVLATESDPRLPQGGVDLIFTCNTYHHLVDRVSYLKSLARYLHPEGRIAIIDFKEHGWFGALFGHATTKETVRLQMEAAGYRPTHDHDFLSKQHFQVFSLNRS
ncbi:MAG TPA: methyltransferase domain-containing protein [Nitrospiraceae bacterium]|nr:methyltransferase domain-containing protein [Nitrospiraceae bacterium]